MNVNISSSEWGIVASIPDIWGNECQALLSKPPSSEKEKDEWNKVNSKWLNKLISLSVSNQHITKGESNPIWISASNKKYAEIERDGNNILISPEGKSFMTTWFTLEELAKKGYTFFNGGPIEAA